jgi:predicted TIM-barrel fold metal-dependent hydrolase
MNDIPLFDIPLFDSLTHPTINGTWIGSAALNNTLAELESEMAANNIAWAFAVGMKDIGGYDLEAYADYIRSASQRVFPIAYYDFNESDTGREIASKLENISRCGYLGIKLHPGFSRIDIRSDGLREVLCEAGSRKLPVLLCTLLCRQTYHGLPCSYLDFGPLLGSLAEPSKIILLHGGDVNVLGLMEICRPYQNVLLDLSFTLCRYEGSSVDLDIRYLFQNFDQRICVGSDNPQFSLAQFRRRFDELAAGLDREKSLNAAHRNLQSFMND